MLSLRRRTLSSSVSTCSGSISPSSEFLFSSFSYAIGWWSPSVGSLFVVQRLFLLFTLDYVCWDGKVQISSVESGGHIFFVESLVAIMYFFALRAFLSPTFISLPYVALIYSVHVVFVLDYSIQF